MACAKAVADAWIKKAAGGDVSDGGCTLLEEQARGMGRLHVCMAHRMGHTLQADVYGAHRRAQGVACAVFCCTTYSTLQHVHALQITLFGECVLSDDGTPNNCQQLTEVSTRAT